MLFQEERICEQRYLENSQCDSCRQFNRRRKMNTERTKARARGVPDNLLPTFNEAPLRPNDNCEMCLQRKAYTLF